MPLAGTLTGLAVVLIILSTRSRRAYDLPLILFHAGMSIWNMLVLRLYTATDTSDARAVLFVVHNVIPSLQATFLWVALRLAGRQSAWLERGAFAGAVGIVLFAHYSFWFVPGDTAFIRGVVRHSWGWYPIAGIGARFYEAFTVLALSTGLLALFLPRAGAAGEPARRVRLLFLFFWLGLATNYLPVSGWDILPIGNAADATLSVAIALSLYGQAAVTERGRLIRHLAAAAGAVSFAVLTTYLSAELFLPAAWFSSATASVLGGIAALAAYHLLIFPRALPDEDRDDGLSATGLIQKLRQNFGLTDGEIGICMELRRGVARGQIPARLRISAGTLKGHLNSIYRKTIDRDGRAWAGRDKLQRLTVFLERLDGG